MARESESTPLLGDERDSLSTTSVTDVTPKKTPLPLRQLIVIAAVSFAEPLGGSIIFPFIYQMIRSFNVTDDEKKLGYYVGLITSVFSFAQVISSIPIGNLSDRWGRRPMMLIGLFGNAISSAFFGLSKSLVWAIVSRGVLGLMNGNIGVAKSMLGEITDETNRAQSFSVLGLMMALGGVAGPALGGLLSNPADNFPIFDTPFWRTYPYALPCLVSSAFSAFFFVFAYFNLPETLGLVNGRKPLENARDQHGEKFGPRSERLPLRAYVPVVSLFFLAFEQIIFGEVFPLFASTPIEDGGLRLDTQQLGTILSINSAIMLLAQILIYPRVANALGPLNTYRLGAISFIPLDFIFPFISLIVRNRSDLSTDPKPKSLFVALNLIMAFKSALSIFSFTSIFIVINNAAPTPRLLGTINGFGQTAATLARTIGPAVGGSLWAWSLSAGLPFPFDYHLVYNFIAIVGLVMYLWSLLVQPSPSTSSKSEEDVSAGDE
ncbi:major facilitator superfamily domain-containing protein [Cladochytrium replicatum]|nr:major facilitator superfamily domain-containing protein [Cladochytrium replicatum]